MRELLIVLSIVSMVMGATFIAIAGNGMLGLLQAQPSIDAQ
jgi:hypothetical protein